MHVALGQAAAGTSSWTAPRDLVLTGGVLMNKSASVLISLIAVALFDTTPVNPDFRYLLAIGPLAFGSANQKIPVLKDTVIYAAFSAAGGVILYFDEVDS
jgi:hypothetical protein